MTRPTLDNCILCEDVRQEVGGKLIILGYLGILPDVQFSIRDFDRTTTLTFLVVGSPGEEPYELDMSITGPDGTVLHSEEGGVVRPEPEDRHLRLNIPLTLKFPQPGRYTFELTWADGETAYTGWFEVEKA